MKRLLLAAGLVLAATLVVTAQQGLFQGLPITGGASYCASQTVSGVPGTAAVCTSTVPAGPASVTGSELVPADTGLTQGRSPQTVKLSMRALNAAPITFVTCAAAACGSNTLGNNSGGIMLAYSTTIDSATVVTPASPMDGQRISIGADHTVTSLTVTANTGSTLAVTTPTVLTASTTAPQGYEFMYVASTTKWYRVR